MALLESIDYKHAPWSERYPDLRHILEHPEQPSGNVIEDNTLIGCVQPLHFDREASLSTIRNNQILPMPADGDSGRF